ncbi:MAG TPA: cyanophycin synthetase [Baekduia sp.]|nr:cyanophycin synthetase [Baekduia sp.]
MPARPWPLTYRPSAWDDPLDPAVSALMPAYNAGVPRHDLDAVRRLLERADPPRSRRRVVVVGTNGKSSTATYLARALTAAGVRTGLSTSPHLRAWTERARVDLEPVEGDALLAALRRVHDVAALQDERRGDLRFFDVLTIATEELFGRAGVDVGVFEAGIGGRLDATRALDPELVLLTSIGADHEAILGRDPRRRLWEKALAAPPGATLLSAPLGAELDAELQRIAAEAGFTAEVVPPDDARAAAGAPAFQRANLALAAAAARRLLGGRPVAPVDPAVDGRFERTAVDGVELVADVAHNPTAWEAFLAELPARPHVLLTAITEPRDPEELVAALAAAGDRVGTMVVTGTTVRPARDPELVAALLRGAGLEAAAVPEPEAAFAAAVAAARDRGLPLAAFGSNYLVVDLLAWARTR